MKHVIAFLALLALISQASECIANDAEPLLAKNTNGESITVEALDDPMNPYKDAYRPWDYWAIQYTNPELSIRKIPEGWKRFLDADYVEGGQLHYAAEESWFSLFPPNWEYQRIQVDIDGFVIPATVYAEMVEENRLLTDFRFSSVANKLSVFSFFAEGPMSFDLQQLKEQAIWDVRVKYFPPVPAWLLEHYTSAVILPDGSFITKSPLDQDKSWLQSIAQAEGNKFVGWTLYSANGEVIDFITGRTWWMELTNPDYTSMREPQEELVSIWIADSYIIKKDIAKRQVLSVADYTGNSLPLDAPINPPGHYCEVLNSVELKAVFHAQQRRFADVRIASGDTGATPGI